MINLNQENLNIHENPINSFENENDCIIFQNSKTKVDVHHRNNSENSSLAEISSNSSLLMDSVSMRNKIYKNSSLNTTENLSKKCMLSSKKDATFENSLEDRENDTRFETNSECKTLDGMIIVVSKNIFSKEMHEFHSNHFLILFSEKANTIINTNATNDLDKDHTIYSDKDSLNSKERDKRYYSDGFLKSKSVSSKIGKHQDHHLEPDVKSLPTQNFFENNEVKINIQIDDLESSINNPTNLDNLKTASTNSPQTSLEKTSTNNDLTKELNSKKRFKSEEFINLTSKCSIKSTKSLANVVLYSPNDQMPFKTTTIKDNHQLSIDRNFNNTRSNKKRSSIKHKKNQRHQIVRLEQPIPSTSTGITHNNPPEEFLKKILSVSGTFLAKSHDDTSTGAVHCFQVMILFIQSKIIRTKIMI